MRSASRTVASARSSPITSTLRSSVPSASTFMPSPTLAAMPTPYLAWSVGLPRRLSDPSSRSSWIRNALWNSSSAAAEVTASASRPPHPWHVARQSAGRKPFPSRRGYSSIRS